MKDLELKVASIKSKLVEDLFHWQRNNSDSFNCKLFTLIGKADSYNLGRLKSAFPLEVEVYTEWHDSLDENEFFDKYLIDSRLL